MERYLREHFEQAVGGDPGVTSDEVARAAIIEGGGLRRRRNRRAAAGVAAGVVLVIGTVAGLNLPLGAPKPADPPITVAAAMMPVTAPSCLQQPVEVDATDVVIFLAAGVTDAQRAALDTLLRDDPRVDAMAFEGREQAFQNFQALWAQNPDLVEAVSAVNFPESFRLRLGAAGHYTAFRAQYATRAGVDVISGRRCSKDAPVGGVL